MVSATLASLVIYAYSSFASSWGVGPGLVKEFEKECACQVKMVDAGNGGAIISRIKLEGKSTDADVVIGLDESLIPRAREELGLKKKITAFDYGPYAFVYNRRLLNNPPQSLDDLLDARFEGQIALEDPRLSTAGLGFMLWVIKEKGDKAWDYFKKLKPQVKVVSPSWDLAYGLFKKQKVQLVFSYWSSPAYHIQEEKNHNYAAAPFKNGHYAQTEYLAVLPQSKKPELAEKFVKFILSAKAQEEFPKKNFMYPIKHVKLPPAFEELGEAKTIDALPEKEIAEHLNDWLKRWREIF